MLFVHNLVEGGQTCGKSQMQGVEVKTVMRVMGRTIFFMGDGRRSVPTPLRWRASCRPHRLFVETTGSLFGLRSVQFSVLILPGKKMLYWSVCAFLVGCFDCGRGKKNTLESRDIKKLPTPTQPFWLQPTR